MTKTSVGVLFGGCSVEHEVSVLSARNAIKALDPTKYDVIVIGIDKAGAWRLLDTMLPPELTKLEAAPGHPDLLSLLPGKTDGGIFHRGRLLKIDVIIPVLHGGIGEDGSTQGLLECLNIPYVGSGVLGSALCMAKDYAKIVLQAKGIPVPAFKVFDYVDREQATYAELSKLLGPKMFVKPVAQGSSIGISAISHEGEFAEKLEKAFRYDSRIIFEKRIYGREIEFALLGTDTIYVSLAGEAIVTKDEFYTYEAKYFDPDGLRVVIPAELSESVVSAMAKVAQDSYRALSCTGLARVDMFYVSDKEYYINELNTLPGFTNSSMYPQALAASGMPFSLVMDKLVELALLQAAQKVRIQTSFDRLTTKS